MGQTQLHPSLGVAVGGHYGAAPEFDAEHPHGDVSQLHLLIQQHRERNITPPIRQLAGVRIITWGELGRIIKL